MEQVNVISSPLILPVMYKNPSYNEFKKNDYSCTLHTLIYVSHVHSPPYNHTLHSLAYNVDITSFPYTHPLPHACAHYVKINIPGTGT